ncbi:PAC2 family protein [Actinomyces sp. F1_1611]
METEKLYTDGPLAGAKAPIMITHFDGAMDAGSTGALSVVQLLSNLSPRRVATFDSDRLIDYRSHRPMMMVENWVTREVVAPEIALDLVHDDTGTPVLILHGPEPDSRWETFTQNVAELARKAGVEVMVSLYGFPAAVPHTRPVSVHVQSTDEDLVPQQGSLLGSWQLPAPLSHFLQYRLSGQNLHGITLYAAVPYYMAEGAFPRGASALLRRLSEMTDLSLPIGDLEQGADADADQVDTLVAQNPEVLRTIEALEVHYDQMAAAPNSPLSSNSTALLSMPAPDEPKGKDSESVAEALGDAIEKYLRAQTKTEEGEGSPEELDASDEAEPGPKHAAPRAWEQDRGLED